MAIALVAGCTSSEPAPAGPDTYLLANTGAWSWSSGDDLTADLLRKADAFCKGQGRAMMPVNTTSKDGGFSNFGHSSLQFGCLRPDDPRLQQPQMERSPDVVIENRLR